MPRLCLNGLTVAQMHDRVGIFHQSKIVCGGNDAFILLLGQVAEQMDDF